MSDDIARKIQDVANAASRKMRAAAAISGKPDDEFVITVRIFDNHVHMEANFGMSSLSARKLSVALAKWADMKDAEQSQSSKGIILP